VNSVDKLLSIIVPVYKAEKHLDRCVESILSQTYGNIELVLVDDGSPDACPAMCDSWAKRDWRVRVIHKKNNGASSARNAGLDMASGEYIGFVDADDFVEPDILGDDKAFVETNLPYRLFGIDGAPDIVVLAAGGIIIMNPHRTAS